MRRIHGAILENKSCAGVNFSANDRNLKPSQERFNDFFKSAMNRKQMTTAVTDFDIKNYRGGSCVLALDSPRKIKPSTACKI